MRCCKLTLPRQFQPFVTLGVVVDCGYHFYYIEFSGDFAKLVERTLQLGSRYFSELFDWQQVVASLCACPPLAYSTHTDTSLFLSYNVHTVRI